MHCIFEVFHQPQKIAAKMGPDEKCAWGPWHSFSFLPPSSYIPFLLSFPPLPPQFMACVLFSGLANSFEGTPDGGRQEVRGGEVADRVERRIILRAVQLSGVYQKC